MSQISKQAGIEFSPKIYCFKYYHEENHEDEIKNLLSFSVDKSDEKRSVELEDDKKKMAAEVKKFEKLIYDGE